MELNKKGWLNEYLAFRWESLIRIPRESKITAHPEHSLYRILQPTGLMYGHAIHTIDHPDAKKWNERDRMKVLLAESLISSSLLYSEKILLTREELSALVNKTIENIGNYYNNIFPELATSSKTLFGRQKTTVEVAERILEKRIEETATYKKNFWSYFFHNSLLFLDVYIFSQWIHTQADRLVWEFFKYEREELRFSVVKVIALAAHANSSIAPEERKLMEYFVQSAGLNSDRRKEANRIFDKGVSLQEINLPTKNSWILKKYFLEMAILTLWADKKLEEQEQQFLLSFCQYLDFHTDDLENSMIAVEGFVLEHWNELELLQNKQDYQQVSEDFISRLLRITSNNQNRLLREVQQNATLMELLRQAKNNEPDGEAKEQMRGALLTILQKVPAISIISLPQHFMSLPVLMRILPPDFFTQVLASDVK